MTKKVGFSQICPKQIMHFPFVSGTSESKRLERSLQTSFAGNQHSVASHENCRNKWMESITKENDFCPCDAVLDNIGGESVSKF